MTSERRAEAELRMSERGPIRMSAGQYSRPIRVEVVKRSGWHRQVEPATGDLAPVEVDMDR